MSFECDVFIGDPPQQHLSLTFATIPRIGEHVLLFGRHDDASKQYLVQGVVHAAENATSAAKVTLIVGPAS